MECNMDEAKRAMAFAERMITQKDYNGAKKFANKAQNLFPELDGLKQLLSVIDVYIAGENKICGETDWYGILGVDPFVDEEAVKKQYRKLALMLHPDKNKYEGAEDAFKLVKEAWILLSDKDKRLSYDIKRGYEAPQRFPTTQSEIPPHQPTSNGTQNVKDNVVPSAGASPNPFANMDASNVGSPAFVSSMSEEMSTFWTKCNNCNIHYQYLRIYLNMNLLCPDCNLGFIAEEKTPPSNVQMPPTNLSPDQHQMRKEKRAWTKINEEQKEKMNEFAERLGWKMHKKDEDEIDNFCRTLNLRRQFFQAWLYKNKRAMKRNSNT